MRRKVALVVAGLCLAVAGMLSAHDLFLKLHSFFLEPDSRAEVALMNGTFEASLAPVARDRMRDVRVVHGDGRISRPPDSAWRDVAAASEESEEADTSLLTFETGAPGTYLIGISTRPRLIELSASDFNAYLQHDGVLDVLALRREQGRLEEPAKERYSKHVKAILQVGAERTPSYGIELGYPIELVPLRNPYELGVGDVLEVRLLRDGCPLPDQLVYASHEGRVPADDEETRDEAVRTRTDEDGVARIPLERPGKWYVRTIHMVETPGESDLDYESFWATLTFQVAEPGATSRISRGENGLPTRRAPPRGG